MAPCFHKSPIMSNITDLLYVHWELCGNRACSYWSMGDNKTGLHCMLEPSAHEMQVSYHHCLQDNMYWWTCVSWAQLCINFEATSIVLVSLRAGSSKDFFSIPWWFCCIACQIINQSIKSLLSTTAMTGLLSAISSGQISDASTSFRVQKSYRSRVSV